MHFLSQFFQWENLPSQISKPKTLISIYSNSISQPKLLLTKLNPNPLSLFYTPNFNHNIQNPKPTNKIKSPSSIFFYFKNHLQYHLIPPTNNEKKRKRNEIHKTTQRKSPSSIKADSEREFQNHNYWSYLNEFGVPKARKLGKAFSSWALQKW